MGKERGQKLIEFLRRINNGEGRAFLDVHPELLDEETDVLLVALSEQQAGKTIPRVFTETVRWLLARCAETDLDRAFEEFERAPDAMDMMKFVAAESPEEMAAMVDANPGFLAPPIDVFIDEMEEDTSSYGRERYAIARAFLLAHRSLGRDAAVAATGRAEGGLDSLAVEFFALDDVQEATVFADRHPLVLTEKAERFLLALREAAVATDEAEFLAKIDKHLHYLRACREKGIPEAFRTEGPVGPDNALFGGANHPA